MLAEELVKEWVFLFKVFFSIAERSAIIFPANSKKSSQIKYFLSLFSRVPLACLFSAFFLQKALAFDPNSLFRFDNHSTRREYGWSNNIWL